MRTRPSKIFRLIILGVLGLAYWNPLIPFPAQEADNFILLDDSLSVQRSAQHSAWLKVAEQVGNLSPGNQVAVLRFAKTVVTELPLTPVTGTAAQKLLASAKLPRQQLLDQSSTDLATAISGALQMAQPGRQSRILLVSDGKPTHGDTVEALELARSLDIPVYFLDLNVDHAAVDAWITDIQLPDHARPGTSIPITAHMDSNSPLESTLVIRIDNQVRAATPVDIDGETQLRHTLELPRHAGPYKVDVLLQNARDHIPGNNQRSALVHAWAPATILYVSNSSQLPPMASSLRAGGWKLTHIAPPALGQHLAQLPTVVILDDVAIHEATTGAWQSLAQAVNDRGMGLIVLGGTNSFSAGGYRRSELEDLLPVTAEASQPEEPASVLFLIDKSGSMDRKENGLRHFSYARKAVVETARSLKDADTVGLLWFDTKPHPVLPIAARNNPSWHIAQNWTIRPSGGTRLLRALEEAVDQLAKSDPGRRLLVLVTDGQLSLDSRFDQIKRKIADHKIDVIALLLGNAPQASPLHDLTDINSGKLLHLRRAAELPRLMSQSVGNNQHPAHIGQTRVLMKEPLSFLHRDTQWPQLSGYMVSRARPGSRIILSSSEGNPLLATHRVGNGRVVALPAGLNGWAQDWLDWPVWGSFVGGLVDWVAPQYQNDNLELRVESYAGKLRLEASALSREFQWLSDDAASVTLRDNLGRAHAVALEELAPGQYLGEAELPTPGRYRASLAIGDEAIQRELLHTVPQEFTRANPQKTAYLLEQDLLQSWAPEQLSRLHTATASGARFRWLFLSLATLLYLGLLHVELRGHQYRWPRQARRIQKRGSHRP